MFLTGIDSNFVLAMITYKSYEKMGDKFNQVLESSLEVPYRSIILVDDSPVGSPGSLNAVRTFALNYGKELHALRSNLYGGTLKPTRATARQTAIDTFLNNFNEKYLFSLDDDFILKSGWMVDFIRNSSYENSAFGMFWGINWDSTDSRRKWLNVVGIDYENYLIREFFKRGGEHDTVHSRASLRDIRDKIGRIPHDLHIYEDAYLLHATIKAGYTISIGHTGGIHMNPWDMENIGDKDWPYILRAAFKYGIPAFDFNSNGYLDLARPVLGLIPALYYDVKAFGVEKGVMRAFKRQYLKFKWRWIVMKQLRDPANSELVADMRKDPYSRLKGE